MRSDRPSIRRAWMVALALWYLVPGAIRAGDASPERFDQIARTAFQKLGPPGLSVAVAAEGQVRFAAGYGLADLEHEVPCTPETVFRIASISKSITAVALMQTIQQGRASLDDPIQQYVPEFPEKPQGPVTLRHLLTHTSGIRHYAPGEFLQTRHYPSLVEAIGIFRDDPLLFPPGERFSYTTYGYNLLAGVVEKTSGQSFGQYLASRVFEPAGMTSSRLDQAADLVPHRARPYTRRSAKQWQNAPAVDLSIKWAGGGILSTPTDLCRLHLALEEGKLLAQETKLAMETPGQTSGGKPLAYALGWNVETDRQGRTWVSHSGGTTGGTSFLLRCPAEGCAAAVIANADEVPGLARLARRLALATLDLAEAEPAP